MQVNAFKLTNQDVDAAFEEGQFRLIYQPQISTKGAKVMAAEAYVRWFHPNFGPIPPGLFLGFVESQGRTRELTNYLLRQAVEAAANWRSSGLNWVATVNVSITDLTDGTLPLTLEILLREHGLEGWHISLDIPETAIAAGWSQWDAIASTLKAIREHQVGIALDCSGPESVPLDQIDPGLFTQLKVGGPAILQFAKSTRHLPFGFIQDRVRFAKENGLISVAVGAEDAASLLALKQIGFDHVQGNAVCPPVPLAELSEWRRTYVPPSLYIYGDDDHQDALKDASASVSTDEDKPAGTESDEEIALTVVGRPVGQKVVETTWQEAEGAEDGDVLEIELTPASAVEVGLTSGNEASSSETPQKIGGFLKGLRRRKISGTD